MFCTHRRTEEERNLEKAKKLQEETKKRRLQNERNMAKVLKGKRSQPMRSVAVTRPKEFDFKVANKQREHNTSTRASSTPFEKKLRQETAVSVSEPFFSHHSILHIPHPLQHLEWPQGIWDFAIGAVCGVGG